MTTPKDLSLLIKNTSAAERLRKIFNDKQSFPTHDQSFPMNDCQVQINTNEALIAPKRGYPRIKSTPTLPLLRAPNQEIIVPSIPPYVEEGPYQTSDDIVYQSMFESLQETSDMQAGSMFRDASYSPPPRQHETSLNVFSNNRYERRPSPLACSSGPTSQVLRLSVLPSPNGECPTQAPTQLKAVPVSCIGFVNVNPTVLDGRQAVRISNEFGEKLRQICTSRVCTSMPDEVAQLLSNSTESENEVKTRSPTIGSIFDKLGCDRNLVSSDFDLYHELNSTTDVNTNIKSKTALPNDIQNHKDMENDRTKRGAPSKTTARKHLKLPKSFFTPSKSFVTKNNLSASQNNKTGGEEARKQKKRLRDTTTSMTENGTSLSADPCRIKTAIDSSLLKEENLCSPENRQKKRRRKTGDKQILKSLDTHTDVIDLNASPQIDKTVSPTAKLSSETEYSPDGLRNPLNLNVSPKSYMLVPSYRGFKDYSPIVIGSRTRSRATDDEKGQLTKPEFSVLVVQRSGDEEKKVILNTNNAATPVIIPGIPTVETANVDQLKGDNEKEKRSLSFNRTSGETILHKAARLGYADLAESKLKDHSDVNAQDNAGWTALHEACSRGQLEVACVLLKYGANVNVCSKSGIRPLHDAVDGNHVGVLRELMAFGADPLIATYAGVTALDFAKTEQIKSLLRGHALDVGYLATDEELIKSKIDLSKELWQFRGSSTVMDHDDDDTLEVIHSAPASQLGTGIEFIVSQKSFPTFYHLPLHKDSKLSGYCNYILLSDALERARIKRDKFLLKHRASVRTIKREELKDLTSKAMIKTPLPDESEGDEIEMIHLGPYAMQTLFGWKFHRF